MTMETLDLFVPSKIQPPQHCRPEYINSMTREQYARKHVRKTGAGSIIRYVCNGCDRGGKPYVSIPCVVFIQRGRRPCACLPGKYGKGVVEWEKS